MKILVASDLSVYALAHCYMRAAAGMGIDHAAVDVAASVRKHVRLGRFGELFHRFVPVETWNRKGNRELALECIKYDPDVLVVFGNAPVLFGTLALIRSVCRAQLVLYWPDTLLNLSQNQLNCAALYDCVATYSSATIDSLQRIGFRNGLWLPFGADVDFLGSPVESRAEFKYDIAFAGGWRPEREAAMSVIARHFPKARMAIFGRSWLRSCESKDLRARCVASEVVGLDYGNLIRESRITLNQIDDTNFPAANMRFFEVPAAGGLQLSSSCPEMKDEMLEGEHVLYYGNHDELRAKVEWALGHPDEADRIRRSGHALVLERHTYAERIKTLLLHLGLRA